MSKKDIIIENDLTYVSYDNYPVSKLHTLVIPKRCVKNYFKLNNKKIIACDNLIRRIKNKIILIYKSVQGFNVGSNSGKVAGQSIFHCDIHVIPRRKADVRNPQGGVRSVIPSKQHYIRKNK